MANKYEQFSKAEKAQQQLLNRFKGTAKSCLRKRGYKTYPEAEAAGYSRKFAFRIYQCAACGCYHLTSKAPRKNKQQKEQAA